MSHVVHFVQVIALSSYTGTAHGSSLSKLPVPEVITTATTNTTQGPIVPNDVTNLEEVLCIYYIIFLVVQVNNILPAKEGLR